MSLAGFSIAGPQKIGPGEVSALVGKTFSVTVNENPTTGYQIALLSTGTEPWKLVSRKYKQDPAKSGAVGVGGKTTFTFKATKKGNGVVAFVAVRMFDLADTLKDAAPIVYNVKVK